MSSTLLSCNISHFSALGDFNIPVSKRLKVIVDDIQKLVCNWSCLGIDLGVLLPKQQLTKQGYQQIDQHRKELYLPWSDTEEFSWMEIVRAVLDKGKTLVHRIAQEFGKFCCVFTFVSLSQ